MATVYLAHDLKHDRDVAIKVLHPDLGAALGGERFLSEIRTTARLQHPHILQLLDSGDADGLLYYVMPLVTGETLRARLERERQLPIPEAVRITCEVASALDYAHRQNVIHRDIKPENILLHDGSALVADFGIALAVQSAGGARMTQTGLSLGTPQYMSPEQAMGEKVIDARSDVYALGAMAYEMLSGEPPFSGPTVQAIVSKVLSTEAATLTSLRRSVPRHVAAAVHAALEKLPADRFDSAHAFAEALRDERFTHAASGLVDASQSRTAMPGSRAARRALLGGTALAVLGLASATWAWRRGAAIVPQPSLELMLDVEGTQADLNKFAVSPDGTTFAFAADQGIYVRTGEQRTWRLLTKDAANDGLSFSPDGRWLIYVWNGLLRKIAISGGTALALIPGDSLQANRAQWSEDGSIVFESTARLYVIPPGGGAPRVLRNSQGAQSPRPLPDGSGVLYVDQSHGSKLMLYDYASDSAIALIDDASEGQYVNTGHIVFGHAAGGLFAVPFDLKRRKVTGVAVPMIADMRSNGTLSPFAIARNGTLVFRAGLESESRLLLREVSGKLDTLPLKSLSISYARFSPDGGKLAVTIGSTRGTDRRTAIYDLVLGSFTDLPFKGGAHAPVWSPDGRQIAFSAELNGSDAEDLFVQAIDGSGEPKRLVRIPGDQHAGAWPTDTVLAFESGQVSDLLLINPLSKDSLPHPYLSAPWGEAGVRVSPDGRFAAYTSFESGIPEIVVRQFPVPRGQWKISASGGQHPRWSSDGRTVFYQGLGATGNIHAVHVRLDSALTVLSREVVMSVPGLGPAWDVDWRSRRMVVSQSVTSASTRIIVIANWTDRLRALGTSAQR